MSRYRVVGVFGVLALASACATSTGTGASSRFEAAPQSSRRATREDADSMVAQSFADREGPRVDVRAVVTSGGASRRLRADFNVTDDAYVMIGHIDANGNVTVVFPSDPKDDGFVPASKQRYETNEFFAGFEDEYRFRARSFGFASYNPQAYDANNGYLFIVASWRPMHFDKFVTDGQWDSFEMVDNSYRRDVKPAVYELAALLAGENREAYTVKFASYSRTTSLGGFYGLGNSAFSTGGICNVSVGGIYNGFGFSPWSIPFLVSGFSSGIFYYRGQQYMYDSFEGCAIPLGYGYGLYNVPSWYYNSYPRIGQTTPPPPTTGTVSTRPRVMAAGDSHRNPLEPSVRQPQSGTPVTVEGTGVQKAETRHLAATDQNRTRPSISQMTERRIQEERQSSSTGWNRGQARANAPSQSTGNNDGWNRARANDGNYGNRAQARSMEGGSNSGYSTSRPTPVDVSSRSAPTSAPAPRVSAPEVHSAPPASSSPAASTAASSGKPTPR
jgi:hypothetical protein